MLFKQFSTCNKKQFSPRLTKIPRFPGKGSRFHLSTGNAPVRIVASPGAYSRFSRRGRDISTILDVRTRSRREELTQRRVENDERTNERTNEARGSREEGKRGNDDLERYQAAARRRMSEEEHAKRRGNGGGGKRERRRELRMSGRQCRVL